MASPLRVIIQRTPDSGAMNMAIDEVLLSTALDAEQSTLRWYRWQEPTLSLGHFQPHDDPTIDDRFAALPKVRRLSGGGAILHDCEWTYSVSLEPGHPLSANPGQLYSQVHETVVEVLQKFRIPAALRGQADQSLDHHFLCFSRGDANDVVVGTHKVLGSAQRRRQGGVLQHGALLLRASEHAQEFPGVLQFCPDDLCEDELFDELTSQVAAVLDPSWQTGALADTEIHLSRELADGAYSNIDDQTSNLRKE